MLSHTWEGIYLQVGLMGQKIKTYAILPGISEFSLGVVPFCILQVIYEKAWVSTALTTKCLPHFWIWANMSKRWNSSLVFIYTYLIRGLPSMGLHRVGHDWSNLAAAAAAQCLCSSSPCFVRFSVQPASPSTSAHPPLPSCAAPPRLSGFSQFLSMSCFWAFLLPAMP